jgi:hypothetical protein
MEMCAQESRDYLDEGRKIAMGERNSMGHPILPDDDHCIALYQEILRLKAIIARIGASEDDESNRREVALLHGKELG